jgi:hypothetical protein
MTHTEAAETLAVERYLLDEMSEAERDTFEAHYFSCAECAADLQAGAQIKDGVRAGLLKRGTVRPFEPIASKQAPAVPARRWASSTMLPWAAAATLAFVAGYQSLILMPGRGRTVEPQALSPVTLRPASRGAEPIVALPAAGGAAVLAIDTTVAPETEVLYSLRTAAGQAVTSGRLRTPAAGPVLLLLPAWTLSPSEHYILSFTGAADGQLIDEYRFAAGPS